MKRPTVAGAATVLLGSACAGVAGCMIEAEPPEEATFRIVAAEAVEVVTSSRFNSVFECRPDCILSDDVLFLESDTTRVGGPHEQTVSLPVPARLFVRATSLTDGNVVSLEVLIGGKRLYDVTRTLAADEYLEHVYCSISLAHPWTASAGPDTPSAERAVGCGWIADG